MRWFHFWWWLQSVYSFILKLSCYPLSTLGILSRKIVSSVCYIIAKVLNWMFFQVGYEHGVDLNEFIFWVVERLDDLVEVFDERTQTGDSLFLLQQDHGIEDNPLFEFELFVKALVDVGETILAGRLTIWFWRWRVPTQCWRFSLISRCFNLLIFLLSCRRGWSTVFPSLNIARTTLFGGDFGEQEEDQIHVLIEWFFLLLFLFVEGFDDVPDLFVIFGGGDAFEDVLRELEGGGKL